MDLLGKNIVLSKILQFLDPAEVLPLQQTSRYFYKTVLYYTISCYPLVRKIHIIYDVMLFSTTEANLHDHELWRGEEVLLEHQSLFRLGCTLVVYPFVYSFGFYDEQLSRTQFLSLNTQTRQLDAFHSFSGTLTHINATLVSRNVYVVYKIAEEENARVLRVDSRTNKIYSLPELPIRLKPASLVHIAIVGGKTLVVGSNHDDHFFSIDLDVAERPPKKVPGLTELNKVFKEPLEKTDNSRLSDTLEKYKESTNST